MSRGFLLVHLRLHGCDMTSFSICRDLIWTQLFWCWIRGRRLKYAEAGCSLQWIHQAKWTLLAPHIVQQNWNNEIGLQNMLSLNSSLTVTNSKLIQMESSSANQVSALLCCSPWHIYNQTTQRIARASECPAFAEYGYQTDPMVAFESEYSLDKGRS